MSAYHQFAQQGEQQADLPGGQTGAARLGAAIEKNLEELGYGG